MKLLFKQRVFSWLDKYDIYNENKEVVFRVEGRMSWGRKLVIFDNDDNELAYIEKALFKWLPSYKMYLNGEEVGTIRKELTLFKPKFQVDYNGWEVEGDFWDWNYEISNNTKTIAVISKEFFAMSDVYTIDVFDESDLLQWVLVVLAIDAIKDDGSNSSN